MLAISSSSQYDTSFSFLLLRSIYVCIMYNKNTQLLFLAGCSPAAEFFFPRALSVAGHHRYLNPFRAPTPPPYGSMCPQYDTLYMFLYVFFFFSSPYFLVGYTRRPASYGSCVDVLLNCFEYASCEFDRFRGRYSSLQPAHALFVRFFLCKYCKDEY